MKIGIISDTHDNVVNVLKAKEIFKKKGVSLILHAGDIICPKTVDYFEGFNVYFVNGNNDGDVERIKFFVDKIKGRFFEEIGEFEIEGKKFCLYHGNDPKKLKKLIESQKYDYVVTGHNHQTEDKKEGKTRVINPGAHYYLGTNTVGILDILNDELEIIGIKGQKN